MRSLCLQTMRFSGGWRGCANSKSEDLKSLRKVKKVSWSQGDDRLEQSRLTEFCSGPSSVDFNSIGFVIYIYIYIYIYISHKYIYIFVHRCPLLDERTGIEKSDDF